MLAIKLKRIGKKHQPSYRLIVAEKRSSLVGRYVEDLGWYNPLAAKENKFKFNKDRIDHWLKTGAQPTATVHNLLILAGILSGAKMRAHKNPKAKEGAPKESASSKPAETAVPVQPVA